MDPETMTDSVTVTRQTAGRGTQVYTYAGRSADAVLAAATRAWSEADPWLRAERPRLFDNQSGGFRAHVVLWSAE